MPTPLVMYSASGIPVGARAIVQVYRPTYSDDSSPNYASGVTKPKVADVIPFGSESSATAVGDPVEIAGLSVSFNANANNTTGVMGQSNNDPKLTRGEPTLNIQSFITSDGQPSILPGDFIVLYVGNKATSTAGTPVRCPASRWVFNAQSFDTAGANKTSASLMLDRKNSDPNLAEF